MYHSFNPPAERNNPLKDSLVEALFRNSALATTGRSATVNARSLYPPDIDLDRVSPPLSFQAVHADPLSPLRARDIEALLDLFSHQWLPEIEHDILSRLSQLVPEPPWEVEPYEFLRDYL